MYPREASGAAGGQSPSGKYSGWQIDSKKDGVLGEVGDSELWSTDQRSTHWTTAQFGETFNF